MSERKTMEISVNQFDNVDEMDKFLETYNVPNEYSKKQKILIASYLLK